MRYKLSSPKTKSRRVCLVHFTLSCACWLRLPVNVVKQFLETPGRDNIISILFIVYNSLANLQKKKNIPQITSDCGGNHDVNNDEKV